MQIHSCSYLFFCDDKRNPTTQTIELPDYRWSIVEISAIAGRLPPNGRLYLGRCDGFYHLISRILICA